MKTSEGIIVGSRILRVAVIFLILMLAGAAGFFGIRAHQLDKEIGALKEEIESSKKKVALFQRNYQEKQNLAEGLLRAKRTLEAQNVEARKEWEQLKMALEAARSDQRSVSKTLSSEVEALKVETQGLKRQISDLDKEKKAIEEKLGFAMAAHKTEVGRLDAEKKEMETSLKSELKRTYQSLDKSEGNNARLCVIARELLDRYENKSVIGSLMAKEPFTQIKRVEIEKLAEEYRERIEQLQVTKKE